MQSKEKAKNNILVEIYEEFESILILQRILT